MASAGLKGITVKIKGMKNLVAFKSLPTCILLCFLGAASFLPLKAACRLKTGVAGQGSQTYYVDDSGGDDGRNGTSPGQAWKSLGKVNGHTFNPGDSILFRSGGRWTGQLWPKGTGTASEPVVVSRYGEGTLPLIDGGGLEDKGVVYLYNQSGWEICNLEVTNDAPSQGMRRGVEIAGEEHGLISHVYLRNLHVHNIRGTVGNDSRVSKRTGGIFFMVWQNANVSTRFDDIRVEDCLIHDCANQGIVTFASIVPYPGEPSWMLRRFTNTVIRGNTIHDITKNAMILRMLDGGLVEYNLCYNTATETTGNTIFTRSSRNVVCQFNEGYNNMSTGHDGSLYDADLESPGCIFQYSYSHDNAHGLYWQCTVQKDTGIVVRYNISRNDRGRIFYINYPSGGTRIYNNTVIIGTDRSPVILAENGNQGGTRTYSFCNNLIYNMSPSARYQWTSPSYIKERTIEHNLFFGKHPDDEPDDPYKLTADPGMLDPDAGGQGFEMTDGFMLTAVSPCIGNGKYIENNGGRDFYGNPLYNGKPDIGANEYTGPLAIGSPEAGRIESGPYFSVSPNPARDGVELTFSLVRGAHISIDIFDLSGRRVRSLSDRKREAGKHSVSWNCRDACGRKVTGGVYLCRLVLVEGHRSTILNRGLLIMN